MGIEWVDHPRFSEAKAVGQITMAEWVSVFDVPPARENRLLLDYSEISRIDVPMSQLIGAAEALANAGIKVAVWAANDTVFGTVRQIILLSRAEEGMQIAAFKDRDSAVTWLAGCSNG